MKVVALKTCDTCRKAIKALGEAGFQPEIIDVRVDGLSDDDAREIVAAFGDRAVNRSSTTWRGLSEHERAQDPMALLQAFPTLLKRPAILHDGSWSLGWKPDVQERLLGKSARAQS